MTAAFLQSNVIRDQIRNNSCSEVHREVGDRLEVQSERVQVQLPIPNHPRYSVTVASLRSEYACDTHAMRPVHRIRKSYGSSPRRWHHLLDTE